MKTEEAFSETGLDWAAFLKALYLLGVVLFVATPLVATVLGGFKSLGELRTIQWCPVLTQPLEAGMPWPTIFQSTRRGRFSPPASTICVTGRVRRANRL